MSILLFIPTNVRDSDIGTVEHGVDSQRRLMDYEGIRIHENCEYHAWVSAPDTVLSVKVLTPHSEEG